MLERTKSAIAESGLIGEETNSPGIKVHHLVNGHPEIRSEPFQLFNGNLPATVLNIVVNQITQNV